MNFKTLKFSIVAIAIFLAYGQVIQAQDHAAFEKEIEAHGKMIVKALNKADTAALLKDFVKTDQAFFVMNGRGSYGYDAVQAGLKTGVGARKSIKVTVKDESITILDHNTAVQIVHFQDVTTGLDDSKTAHEGIWTAFYQKIDGELKVVGVHESYNAIDK